MPRAMVVRTGDVRTDGPIVDLTGEIESLVLRQTELWEELRGMDGEAGNLSSVAQAFADLRDTFEEGADKETMTKAFERVRDAIQSGTRRSEIWEEMRASFLVQRRLVETQRKVEGAVSPEQLFIFASALQAILRRRISDQDLLREIGADMRALGAHGGVRPGEPVGVVDVVDVGGNGMEVEGGGQGAVRTRSSAGDR